MATITKSIGVAVGRDYSTLQSWADAIPVNVVASGNSYVGECYNDMEFFDVVQPLLISGRTTDSTHTITLTTATGQSFRDHANAQTNPLHYNQYAGVAIGAATGSDAVIKTSVNYVKFKNLQIKQYTASGGPSVEITGGSANGCVVENCIIETMWTNTNLSGATIINSAIINKDISGTRIGEAWYASAFYNCTIINPSNFSSRTRFFREYSVKPTFQNCAFYGASAITDNAAGGPTFTTCYTDIASPPSGCTTAAYNSTQFNNTTSDWKITSGSALKNTGTTDSTNAPTDIVGTSRPQGAAYDVGAWEYITAASSSSGSGGEGKSKYMRG